jgi:hypothetical protein
MYTCTAAASKTVHACRLHIICRRVARTPGSRAKSSNAGLARTVHMHLYDRISGDFPAKKRNIHHIYIYVVLANPLLKRSFYTYACTLHPQHTRTHMRQVDGQARVVPAKHTHTHMRQVDGQARVVPATHKEREGEVSKALSADSHPSNDNHPPMTHTLHPPS